MSWRKAMLWALAAAGAAGFVYGLVQLLMLRFETGDVYPPYSTLRTDPMGAQALYEALEEVEGVSVRRSYRPLGRLAPAPRTTLMVLGAGRRLGFFRFDEKAVEKVLGFVAAGGRLVLAFSPNTTEYWARREAGDLAAKLDFALAFDAPGAPASGDGATARPAGGVDGGELTWRAPAYFAPPPEPWRAAWRRGDKPVIIERPYERGSVVVMADSFHLSNEAMLAERRPALLAWLIGNRRVVFDETHLGVERRTGIATLGRRYNLAGVLAALLVLAGLFVWRSWVSFIPRDPERARRQSGPSVSGRGAEAGLFSLLRKAIAPGDVLNACVTEWDRSEPAPTPLRRRARKRIEAVLDDQETRPKGRRSPVAAYRSICRILSERT